MAILKWVQETDVDWHDFSRYIIAWKLCTNMRAGDVTDTIETGVDGVRLRSGRRAPQTASSER